MSTKFELMNQLDVMKRRESRLRRQLAEGELLWEQLVDSATALANKYDDVESVAIGSDDSGARIADAEKIERMMDSLPVDAVVLWRRLQGQQHRILNTLYIA